MKRYIEVTIAYDNDPVTNPNGVLEVSHRDKVDEGAWGDPSETTQNASKSSLSTTWVELEIKKV